LRKRNFCIERRNQTNVIKQPLHQRWWITFRPRGFSITFWENQTMAQIADRNTVNAAPNLPIQGARATAAQLCTKYQVSRTTWWRWSQSPGFPAPMRFGRSVRWSPEAVDSFLTQQEG
jgi:predicted DNA-binding transcriptional regulator AlpA